MGIRNRHIEEGGREGVLVVSKGVMEFNGGVRLSNFSIAVRTFILSPRNDFGEIYLFKLVRCRTIRRT